MDLTDAEQHERSSRWYSPHRLRSNKPIQIALCVPLGAIVGLIVVAMHEVVAWLHRVDFMLPASAKLSAGVGIDPLHLVLVPAGGGLVLALVGAAWRRIRPREIIDPIEANAIHGGRMTFIESLRLAIETIISNAAGASVGMEAAYSQMGSGTLSKVGQWLRLRRADLRVFVAAGAAAAIAAAFNAPLAGAFYAYELVLGSYTPAALAQVATASLAGTLVVRATLGVAPIFLAHPWGLEVQLQHYPWFLLLGVLAAGIGIATMMAATACERGLHRLPLPRWMRPVLGGAALSFIALAFPQVLGSGHGAIEVLVNSTPMLMPVTFLLVAKMMASAVSIGTGFRGGLFSASLFIGCLFGSSVSQGLGLFDPWLADQQRVFMLVGMGAVAASIVGAPITMVLLVLEVTGDLGIALGGLLGVVTAATITQYTFGYSFSTWRFHQKGVPIRGAFDVGWINELTVRRLMVRDIKTVRRNTSLLRLRTLAPLGSAAVVFAVDDDDRYAGLIELAVAHDPEIDDAAPGLVAADLAGSADAYLLPGMDIRAALGRFEETERETLPVLSSASSRRIVGYLSEADALRRYAEELERRHDAEIGFHPPVHARHTLEGESGKGRG